jgi:hypothetical protein
VYHSALNSFLKLGHLTSITHDEYGRGNVKLIQNLTGKSKGKRSFVRTKHRREDNIKMYVRKISCELGQNTVQWKTFVNIMMDHRFP